MTGPQVSDEAVVEALDVFANAGVTVASIRAALAAAAPHIGAAERERIATAIERFGGRYMNDVRWRYQEMADHIRAGGKQPPPKPKGHTQGECECGEYHHREDFL